MWKNQLFYGSILLVLAVLLFLFSNPFLLYAIITLLVLAAFAWILLSIDAKGLSVELQFRSGIQLGREMMLILEAHTKRRLLVTGCIAVKMKITYEMFQESEEKVLLLPSDAKGNQFQLWFCPEECGEVHFTCEQIRIHDLLNLFERRITPFPDGSTTVYPERFPLQVELSHTIIGSFRDNGLVQNRKGDDLSEMFDIRDYVPGDDVRSIHWKLSSKSDHLVLRQASDRFHYHVALLPDIGLWQGTEQVSHKERNAAAAIYASLGEKLAAQGETFCMLIPSEQGIEICEITGLRDYEKAIAQWLSTRLPQQTGLGMQYFTMEHLEQYFSRLILVTAGKYNQSLQGLENRISVTVIHAAENGNFSVTDLNESGRVIEIPCKNKGNEDYHILC